VPQVGNISELWNFEIFQRTTSIPNWHLRLLCTRYTGILYSGTWWLNCTIIAMHNDQNLSLNASSFIGGINCCRIIGLVCIQFQCYMINLFCWDFMHLRVDFKWPNFSYWCKRMLAGCDSIHVRRGQSSQQLINWREVMHPSMYVSHLLFNKCMHGPRSIMMRPTGVLAHALSVCIFIH
jgi:hypothetical protein